MSGVVVIATQVADDAVNDAEKARLLYEVTRAQYRLQDVKLKCWTAIPTDDPRLKGFRERFVRAVTAARSAEIAGATIVDGINGWGSRNYGPPHEVKVCGGSHLYPDEQTEPEAFAAFRYMEVTLYFYREPIPPSKYPYQSSGTSQRPVVAPDIAMTFRDDRTRDDELCIEYDFELQRFALGAWDLTTDRDYWNSSGKIISVADLSGAQVFVEVSRWRIDVAAREDSPVIAPRPVLMILKVGELSSLWIHPQDLTRHVGEDGHVFWEYRFPKMSTANPWPR
jgi:hypothetical protein